MNRPTLVATVVLLVCGVAVTNCGSSSRGATEASAGTSGTSESQGGGGSDASGAAGAAVAGNGGESLGGSETSGGATGSTGATAVGGIGGSEAVGGATSPPTTLKVGRFLLYSAARDGTTRTHSVYATFYSATSEQCTSILIGACHVNTGCFPAPEPQSAGTLSVTSPATSTLPANDVTLSPSATGTYPASPLSGALLGGELLHLAASGATVPAFSADLTAPLPLLIDSPVSNSTGTISTNSAGDLLLKFSRGASGVVLYAESSDGTIECYSEPGANTLTIPQSALAGADTLNLYTRSARDIAAGPYTVTTSILLNALTPDKASPVKVVVN